MPAQPDLRNLSSFVAAAEELHFTRAAQRLHLTQQALSTQIRQLEGSLGVQLFHRTTRRVELTDAGRTLLAHAIPLLAGATRAWEAVIQADRGEVGHVSLSYAPTMRRQMLPLLLEEFGRRYPGIEVRSAEVWWGDSPLIHGPVEVTINRSRPEAAPDVASVPIFHSLLGLMLGRDHRLAARPTVAIRDLRGEALKFWPRAFSPHFYDVIMGSLHDAGWNGRVEELVIFGSRMLQDDPDACDDIIRGDGFGIGFERQYAALEPDIVWRRIAPDMPIPMHLSWRRDASAAVRNFVSVTLDVADERGMLPDGIRAEAELLLLR